MGAGQIGSMNRSHISNLFTRHPRTERVNFHRKMNVKSSCIWNRIHFADENTIHNVVDVESNISEDRKIRGGKNEEKNIKRNESRKSTHVISFFLRQLVLVLVETMFHFRL